MWEGRLRDEDGPRGDWVERPGEQPRRAAPESSPRERAAPESSSGEKPQTQPWRVPRPMWTCETVWGSISPAPASYPLPLGRANYELIKLEVFSQLLKTQYYTKSRVHPHSKDQLFQTREFQAGHNLHGFYIGRLGFLYFFPSSLKILWSKAYIPWNSPV